MPVPRSELGLLINKIVDRLRIDAEALLSEDEDSGSPRLTPDASVTLAVSLIAIRFVQITDDSNIYVNAKTESA